MTREEAAEIIDKVGNDVIAIVKKPIKDGSYTKNDIATAKEMAIRSLEAWDKVIEDINKSLSMVEDTGIRTGYVIAEEIIKDHLREVNGEKQFN